MTNSHFVKVGSLSVGTITAQGTITHHERIDVDHYLVGIDNQQPVRVPFGRAYAVTTR